MLAALSSTTTNRNQPPPTSTPPPTIARATSSRRRSTSNVFTDSRHSAPLSLSSQSHAATALSREVQQDALELSGAQTDDPEEQERVEQEEILTQGDWAQSEIALFRRLRRRGREPLLPAPWRLDFATFPEALYTPVGELSFICALTPSMEFRGEGPVRNRDSLHCRLTAAVPPITSRITSIAEIGQYWWTGSRQNRNQSLRRN
ncbi:hypothetical protein ABW20_dc0109404 [Dactylellina cionopaga]|nr:hypothetical protein ABW20_dc0109404 [Dactylellina cionopaga]